jgi:hypothetical protein
MIDMFSLMVGMFLGAASVIVGFLLPTSRRTKRAGDGLWTCSECGLKNESNLLECDGCETRRGW